MNSAKKVKDWMDKYFEVNGIFPSIIEIQAQLDMAIEEEAIFLENHSHIITKQD